jgi:ATP/maltotriose-dependent transcriptional regulator MalT
MLELAEIVPRIPDYHFVRSSFGDECIDFFVRHGPSQYLTQIIFVNTYPFDVPSK